MTEEVLNLWPARVVTPDCEYGDANYRVRALVYTTDGATRLLVFDAMGGVLARTPVESFQHNGGGGDIVTPDGAQWLIIALGGCSTCGGGASAGMAFQVLQRGDEILQ